MKTSLVEEIMLSLVELPQNFPIRGATKLETPSYIQITSSSQLRPMLKFLRIQNYKNNEKSTKLKRI